MSDDLVKEVWVVYESSRRIVRVNFQSLEETVDAVRREWGFSKEARFELQAYCGEKGRYFDIFNVDDLKRHENTEELIVRSYEMAGVMSLHQHSPPEHKVHTKITVHCGNKKKPISVDIKSFKAVHGTIKERFQLTDNFQLQVQDANGERIDIDCDGDLEDNAEILNTMWVAKRRPNRPEDKAVMVALSTSVEVGGKKYSIIEAPEKDSEIVKPETDKMKKVLEVEKLSEILQEVADCLKVAYYAACAQRDRKEYVTDLQFDFRQVCFDLDKVMLVTETEVGDALDDLHCGLGYMLDGFEKLGVERMGSIGKHFEQIRKSVEKIIQQVGGTEQAHFFNHTDLIRIAEERIKSLKSEEDEAREFERLHSAASLAFGLGGDFLSFLHGSPCKELVDREKRRGDEARRERLEEEKRLKVLKQRKEAKVQASATDDMDGDPNRTETYINAAETATRRLRAVLGAIKYFWEKNEILFKSVAAKQEFDNVSKVEKERRKEYLSTPSFKRQALASNAKFVAIQRICADVRKTVAPVRDSIHKVISDNPTTEEAKERLPDLIRNLKVQVDKDAG